MNKMYISLRVYDDSNVYEVTDVVDLSAIRQHWQPRAALVGILLKRVEELLDAAGEEGM